MKHLKLLAASLVLLTACGKKFPEYLAKGEKAFAEKDYIDTIDALNDGLLRWRESDGAEKKGRAYELLGKSYHQLRNTDKAIVSYAQAVQLSSNTYDSAYDMGMLQLAKSQSEPARKSFLLALKMRPDDPLSLLGLGNAYFAQKKFTEARLAFEKVLDVSPGVREAMDGLANLKPSSSHQSEKKPAPEKKPATKKTKSKSTQRKRR